MKKLLTMLMLLVMALSFTAMAETADYVAYIGGTYTCEDPWGGRLTVTVLDIVDGKMDWSFMDQLDGMTLRQTFEGAVLTDGATEFHAEGAAEDMDFETFDYTGTIALKDGVVYITLTDGQLTEHSENGGSTAYHVAALDELDRALLLKPLPVEEAEAIERFCDVWVDDDAAVEIWFDGEFHCRSTLGDDMGIDYDTCVYNEDEGTLTCEGGTRYYAWYDEAADELVTETVVTDLTADFELIENGTALIWNDSEGICKRFVLKRLADAEEEEWLAAQAFVGRWGQGRCTIDITDGETGDYHVYITWGDSASTQVVWEYDCVYDGETDRLYSYAPGVKRTETWGESGEIVDIQVEYEDGDAYFSIDAQDMLTWNDRKENAAEDMLFERGELLD